MSDKALKTVQTVKEAITANCEESYHRTRGMKARQVDKLNQLTGVANKLAQSTHYCDADDAQRDQDNSPMQAGELKRTIAFYNLVKKAIGAVRDELGSLDKEEARKHNDVISAKRDEQPVKKLRENAQAQTQVDASKREQRSNDDVRRSPMSSMAALGRRLDSPLFAARRLKLDIPLAEFKASRDSHTHLASMSDFFVDVNRPRKPSSVGPSPETSSFKLKFD